MSGRNVAVKGPLGSLSLALAPCNVLVESVENGVRVSTGSRDKLDRSLVGTYWRLINNMIIGVTEGFKAELELVGVGYRAKAEGGQLSLSLGYSNPITCKLPEGISVEMPTQTEIVVKGIDKQVVGQFAEEVKRLRPTEPYKGKGVKTKGQQITLKETKKK